MVAVAYGTSAPSLAIAEFAPAARQTVEPPPTTAREQIGRGPSGSGGRSATSTTAAPPTVPSSDGGLGTSAPTTRVGRSRPCVGNPPRQIEDPQSPPCIATIFEGDNGGATSPGIDATSVRVGVPIGGDADKPAFDALFAYFNQTFELYGRRLTPVYVSNTATADPVSNRALATDLANQNVFAVVPMVLEWNASLRPSFLSELARQHVITLPYGLGAALSDTTVFDELHPYVWSATPSIETIERNLADFFCTSLAGRPARHAGAGLSKSTRKFGLIVVDQNGMPPTRPFSDGMAGCEEQPVVATFDSARQPADVLRTSMLAMKAAGVTTVTCVCTTQWTITTAMQHGIDNSYEPEWIMSVDRNPLEELVGQGIPAAVRSRAMFFSERPKALPLQARPWFQALQMGNPALTSGSLGSNVSRAWRAYPQLLVLASGVQMAGPNLSPETFAAGLMSTVFPNPGAGQAPYWQPAVGFGVGDHGFTDDFTLASWSETLPSIEPSGTKPQGSWCYLDRGARYSLGHFPTDADDRLFGSDAGCR